MDATAAAGADFGTGRLFLADSRLAVIALNDARHWTLKRLFGVSREQANLLTFVLALSAADAAYETTRRVIRAPLRVSGADAAMGGFLLREAAVGIAGTTGRGVPYFGTLLTVGVVGSLAVPGLRRAVRTLRSTEHRVREQRISRYRAAMRAARA